MPSLNKKQMITLSVIFVFLVILAIVLTIKPWVNKPKSVKATQVGKMKVFSPVLSSDSKDIYYYDLNALNLFKYNLKSNKSIQLTSKMADVPDTFIWSPDRSNIIIRFLYDKTKFESEKSIFANPSLEDGSTMLWNYNLSTEKFTILKNDIALSSLAGLEPNNPIWTADSKQIIYYYYNENTKQNNLAISNPDGASEQIVGLIPLETNSIISYDSQNKVIYYSTQVNEETEICKIYKYNITTAKNDLLFTSNGNESVIDDHRFAVYSNDQSIIYDTSDNSQKVLPISIRGGALTPSPDKTKLLADVITDKREDFYIIDIKNLKIIKKFNPGIEYTSYTDFALDADLNIFFTDKQSLFEIKN